MAHGYELKIHEAVVTISTLNCPLAGYCDHDLSNSFSESIYYANAVLTFAGSSCMDPTCVVKTPAYR